MKNIIKSSTFVLIFSLFTSLFSAQEYPTSQSQTSENNALTIDQIQANIDNMINKESNFDLAKISAPTLAFVAAIVAEYLHENTIERYHEAIPGGYQEGTLRFPQYMLAAIVLLDLGIAIYGALGITNQSLKNKNNVNILTNLDELKIWLKNKDFSSFTKPEQTKIKKLLISLETRYEKSSKINTLLKIIFVALPTLNAWIGQSNLSVSGDIRKEEAYKKFALIANIIATAILSGKLVFSLLPSNNAKIKANLDAINDITELIKTKIKKRKTQQAA